MKLKYLLILSFFLLFFSINAQHTVTGIVLEDDEPLIGVTVTEEGTSNGTITDFDGTYKIEVADPNASLIYSYIGYATQSIAVDGRTEIDLVMTVDATELEEIIVVGYGVQKKKVVTGAISKVKGEDLEDMPVLRIENSLLGRTSGVRVTTDSGQPGSGGTVRIRGTTTIGDSNPLYVVDGVPIGGGIDYLNQGDIESIEVLKDAASASIYGARSANGVILITTKKGKEGTEVSFSSYYGTQAPWKKVTMLNATEYATLMNESSVAAGGGILYPNPAELGEGTDWQSLLLSENAPIQNHEVSISAGSKNSTYYASFGYFNQTGIVAPEQSNYKRFTARLNTEHKINKKLKFGNTLAYTRIKSQGIEPNSEFGSPLSRILNIDPLTPVLETDPEVLNSPVFVNNADLLVRNEDGIPYGISSIVTSEVVNPIAALSILQGFGWSDKVVGNFYGEINIIDGLKFRSSIGTDLAFWGGEGFTPLFYLNATNRSDLTNYNRSSNRGLKWILENTLSYSKVFGAHDLSVLVGTVGENNAGEGIGGSAFDVPFNHIDDASLGIAIPVENQRYFGYEYVDRLASYVSRVNYNYAQKYLFSATMRVDGSSKFGSNNKFGFFPSASIGWVLTEENFLSNNNVINFLKFRGSWGVNGNNKIADFLFVSTVGGGRNYTFGLDDQFINGVSPNAIANPDLRWEETSQTNFGFDAKIFKKISITFDVFEKLTTGMLQPINVPLYVGNDGPTGNVATMENRGIELELAYNNKFGEFNFDIAGNVSYIENKVTDLGPEKDFLIGQTFSPQGLQVTRTSVGLPVGYFYGFKTDGIFQNQEEVDRYVGPDGSPIQPEAAPGDFKFVDINDDGIIDDEDRGFIGDPTPNWTYGLNFSAGWKGLDLRLFAQGVDGNQVFKATRRFDLQAANMTADALDRWTGEGTTNEYPRLIQNDPNKNFSRSSDFYLEDGAFFRLKTLQLGYNLPSSILNKIRMKKLRVYVSGNNLVTFTKYSGFDPEIGGNSFGVDRGSYPQARFFLIGLNASF